MIISFNITQSHAFAHKGLDQAAGLFFSKKKCPDQANGYTMNGVNNNNSKFELAKQYTIKQIVDICPNACNLLHHLFVCSVR